MTRERVLPLALCTGLFVASALAVATLRPFGGGPPQADLQLRARAVDGRIQVNWNPAHPEVIRAASGVLRAQDGPAAREYPLPANVIRGGSLDYLPSSDDVLLTLMLKQGSGAGLLASVRAFAAPLPASPSVQKAEPPSRPSRRAQSRSRRRR